MRRRHTPYSCIEEVRRSRAEVWGLILVTVLLGVLLGLLTDALFDLLRDALPAPLWGWTMALIALASVALTLIVIWIFYGRTESRQARLGIWLPYHFPTPRQATIARATAYQPPRHARRAFMRRYPNNSPELEAFLEAYTASQDQPFQRFIADDHLALTQCLALYVLHRYGEESLGPEAPYGWWEVDMGSRKLAMDDLPSPLRDNPFLRADQSPDEWRLILPQGVTFEATSNRWELRHRRYGRVVTEWLPYVVAAGRRRRPYQALTTRMQLEQDAQLYAVGSRVEATAHLRWTLLLSSEPFHRWATGLLARLEEALDFQYYIATRPDRVVRDLEWKVGWVPQGSSLVDMLQGIDGRLEALETDLAAAALDQGEEEGESIVV
jgi:hypothetical protein